MVTKVEIDGAEVEVYTAAERDADVAAAKTAAEGEWKPKYDELNTKLTKAEQAAAQRAVEFGQFRKLSEDQVKALSEKDAIIYANQLEFQKIKESDDKAKKIALESQIDSELRKKVGSDEKLFAKAKDMYGLIGIEATTPEQIQKKVLATLGALGQTEPDLIASVFGAGSGSFEPPKPAGESEKTFADTEKGKMAAKDLGLTLEVPKK